MIYGQRVQQLRVMHGMTQGDLADRVLIQQSTLSRIEQGRVECDLETAAMLAVELGVTDDYLARPPLSGLEAHSPQFRARSRVTQRDRGSAMQWAGFIDEEFQRLMAAATPIPPRLDQVRTSDPIEAAHSVREQLGFSPSEPLPYIVIAVERLGVRVLGLPLTLPTMDAFSAWQDNTPIIGLLSGVPADRLRFNVAHELGHLVMHQRGRKGPELEAEADEFAAELLTPRASILKSLPKAPTLNNLTMIKTQWGVSIKALVRRARELEVIDADKSLSLYKQISKRGWNRKEPGFVPMEKPRAFRKLAEISYGSGPNLTRMASGSAWGEEALMRVLAEHATTDELPRRAPRQDEFSSRRPQHASQSPARGDRSEVTNDNVVYFAQAKQRRRSSGDVPSRSAFES